MTGDTKVKPKPIALKNFFTSSISSILARNLVTPLERIIQLKQTNEIKQYYKYGRRNDLMKVTRRIFRRERVFGFFKGNGMNLCRVIPQDTIDFSLY